MCHILWAAGIRLSILQQNCSTQVLRLIFEVSVRTRKSWTPFQNSFAMYYSRSGQPTLSTYLCCFYYRFERMLVVTFQADCSRCQGFPMCITDDNEFTFVCFWIELLQFLVEQRWYSLESLYVTRSLASTVLNASSKYVFFFPEICLGCL